MKADFGGRWKGGGGGGGGGGEGEDCLTIKFIINIFTALV